METVKTVDTDARLDLVEVDEHVSLVNVRVRTDEWTEAIVGEGTDLLFDVELLEEAVALDEVTTKLPPPRPHLLMIIAMIISLASSYVRLLMTGSMAGIIQFLRPPPASAVVTSRP